MANSGKRLDDQSNRKVSSQGWTQEASDRKTCNRNWKPFVLHSGKEQQPMLSLCPTSSSKAEFKRGRLTNLADISRQSYIQVWLLGASDQVYSQNQKLKAGSKD